MNDYGKKVPKLLPILLLLGAIAVQACQRPATMPRFDVKKFDGNWFVYQSTYSLLEAGWVCKRVQYSETSDRFRYSYKTSATAAASRVDGTYKFPEANKGYWEVSVSVLPSYSNSAVAGDLTNFVVIRSCSYLIPFVPTESTTVLTRTPNPSVQVKRAIDKSVRETGVDPSSLILISQENC